MNINARITIAKKKTVELSMLWKDRGLRKEVKAKLVKALIWQVITYSAEAWTLKKTNEKRIEAVEMWIYRRVLRVSWMEKRTTCNQ